MKLMEKKPPRVFEVGHGRKVKIKDCARIDLGPDEQVTFSLDSGAEYDVARKSWGFYATPSLNGRLKRFGLRGVLVRGPDGKHFVWLVEKGKEPDFLEYLTEERHDIVMWLDGDELECRVAPTADAGPAQREKVSLVCLCGSERFQRIFTYEKPPFGEIRFAFSSSSRYHREIQRCNVCGHFISICEMDNRDLYSGDYVDSNYRDSEGLKKTYERIIGLPPARSDNIGRVQCVLQFAERHFQVPEQECGPRSILDIGSGLCVFLHEMKKAGWNCTALDPDHRAAEHAEKIAGVEAICGDFMEMKDHRRYDVITFNRVLEHVGNPVEMLARAREHLNHDGFVYVEVPDGESAVLQGMEREEFTIDHIHIFSMNSLSILAKRAEFNVRAMERLQEPSSKFTLRAFLVSNSSAGVE